MINRRGSGEQREEQITRMRKIQITAAQTAVLMAILTLGSKFVGFIREMVLANYFGTSFVVDAYTLAQSIPTMIFGSIFSAVAISFMPVYSKKYELEGAEEANLFTSRTLNILMLVSAISAALGLVFSDQLVAIFSQFSDPKTIALTSFYLKVTFSFIIFNSVSTLLEAFLQYKSVFLPQIIIGYLQSACIIAVAVVSAFTSYYYLAFGILLGCALRALGVSFLAKKNGFRYSFDWKLGAATKEIMLLAMPVFIGGSINQINAFVDRMLASGLPEGSIAALNYGNLIVSMVNTMTVTIMVTIIYPKMTQANALKDYERLGSVAERGINLAVLVALPCTMGAMVYSEQIIQVVYERGAFDPAATALTGPAFFYYAIGLVFLCLNTLLTKIYYSFGDTRTPVYCGFAGMIVNVGLNLILVRFMAHGGLALATSVAAAVNAFGLYYLMKRKYSQFRLIRSTKKMWMIGAISAVSVGISYGVYRMLGDNLAVPRLILLGISVAAAGIVYLFLLFLAKIEEVNMVKDLFRRG